MTGLGRISVKTTTVKVTAKGNSLKELLQISACGVLVACGGGGSSGQTGGISSPSVTIAVAPAPSPPPAPPPPPPAVAIPSPTLAGLAEIKSNFDIETELVPSWGTGAIPGSETGPVGAFRFICTAGQLAKDDPIVYPGQAGRSHLHQFFGNTGANASSTYESLRTTGDSTCNNKLNRSAYWMPAMMNGKGQVVRPDYIAIYYKRRPASDPACQVEGTACVDLPRGLRFVFGHDMLNPNAAPTGSAYFNCDGPTATPGHYPTIVSAAKNCPAGNRLGAVINAPNCWDGKNLDSSDHRSHIAYQSYGDWGYAKCPASHPYIIPSFTMGVWYTTDDDLDRSGTWDGTRPTWHLSSDVMPGAPMMIPGSTFHADWFGAWDDSVMKMWSDNCINKKLNCSGADLGNGKQMKMFAGFSWEANPRIVNPPQ